MAGFILSCAFFKGAASFWTNYFKGWIFCCIGSWRHQKTDPSLKSLRNAIRSNRILSTSIRAYCHKRPCGPEIPWGRPAWFPIYGWIHSWYGPRPPHTWRGCKQIWISISGCYFKASSAFKSGNRYFRKFNLV